MQSLRYLFPWSDRLDQERVLKALCTFRLKSVKTLSSQWMFPLQFLPRKQWFSSHSVTPCRFLKKNSSSEMAWLVLDQTGKSVLMVCTKSFKFFVEHSGKSLQTLPFYPSNRQKPFGSCFVRICVQQVPVFQSPRLLTHIYALKKLDLKHFICTFLIFSLIFVLQKQGFTRQTVGSRFVRD